MSDSNGLGHPYTLKKRIYPHTGSYGLIRGINLRSIFAHLHVYSTLSKNRVMAVNAC